MTPTPRRPSVTDVAVALAVGATTLIALIATPQILGPAEGALVDPSSLRVTGVALVAQAVALCFVRGAPRLVLLLIALAAMLVGVISPTGVGNLAHTAVLVAVLLVAVSQGGDVLGSSDLPLPAVIGAAVLQALVIVGLPAAGVLAVTARRDARLARHGESEAVQRERDALVQAAVAHERTAMARELHDIAAHHVSSIALMSAAIERQIPVDPDAATRSVRQVREQSRALLDDLRRLVGLLRRDGDDPETIETLETIPALVATARATGREVELRVSGTGAGIGPLSQLVVYRMVQEALANAGRHAPDAPCVVELDGTAVDTFTATVRNAPAGVSPTPSRDGFGLLGMRERAGLVGGRLDAGPDPDGGWTVRLTLPAEPATPNRKESE
jgi:signal transduction histidine kinase